MQTEKLTLVITNHARERYYARVLAGYKSKSKVDKYIQKSWESAIICKKDKVIECTIWNISSPYPCQFVTVKKKNGEIEVECVVTILWPHTYNTKMSKQELEVFAQAVSDNYASNPEQAQAVDEKIALNVSELNLLTLTELSFSTFTKATTEMTIDLITIEQKQALKLFKKLLRLENNILSQTSAVLNKFKKINDPSEQNSKMVKLLSNILIDIEMGYDLNKRTSEIKTLLFPDLKKDLEQAEEENIELTEEDFELIEDTKKSVDENLN